MATENYIKVLARFISGDITPPVLQRIVDSRLSELRLKPVVSEEREVLSTIELYLHEMAEGFRSKEDLYTFVSTTLDRMISRHTDSAGATEHKRCVVRGTRCDMFAISESELRRVPNNTTEVKTISLSPVR